MTTPFQGGRYVRDPKTGALTRADETTPTVALPEADNREIKTGLENSAPMKKGK